MATIAIWRSFWLRPMSRPRRCSLCLPPEPTHWPAADTFRVNERITAYATWEAPRAAGGERELHIYVDEANASAFLASQHLLRRALTDIGTLLPAIYRLRLKPGQSSLRRAAIANRFFRAAGSSPRAEVLKKVAVGRLAGSETWAGIRESLRLRSGIGLPMEVQISNPVQPIDITDTEGNAAPIKLAELERLLSPFIMALPGRAGVVLPITPAYAEDLFRGSTQPSFLSDREAALRSVRGYIGGAATYRVVPDGGLAIF